ncbi:thioredoxin domain-containing protein 12 [Biomphalaria pfeifferi]|uniref:Thioredoxin domain-containing protein 12 n=1 Tax=Biomphalaria pfeifferi TaxID=112525 RepID=A0AAD8FAE6_BIOPF|nr:thioredoxin domain-containing protein 12 [Biomphalaria pfeifferi]
MFDLVARVFKKIRSFRTKDLTYTSGDDNHRGWGEKIDWYTLGVALQKAKKEHKHMMIVIHRMTCSACWYQKSWFSKSPAILNLSKNFVMVNMEAGRVPNDEQFSPDGHYVPRILFFNPQGRLMPHVKFSYNDLYQYNYPGEGDLIRNMKLVAEKKM